MYNGYDSTTIISDNIIDFKKLKESIVEQQSKISQGIPLKSPDNEAFFITIGNNYFIENIDGALGIYLDNYLQNKDKLTIITIMQSGKITMPPVFSSYPSSTISTSDWFGQSYSDSYYGNIVWNFPNATSILFSGASFPGHVIAPNADINFPTTNFAGAMICNSLYAQGNTEAHYYPISVDESVLRKAGDLLIKGKKTWDDNNDKKGIRPKSINVTLYANNIKYKTLTVTEKEKWEYEFNNLPETDGSKKITYKIEEDEVKGYTTNLDGYNLINKISSKDDPIIMNPHTGRNVIFTVIIILVSVGLITLRIRKNRNI